MSIQSEEPLNDTADFCIINPSDDQESDNEESENEDSVDEESFDEEAFYEEQAERIRQLEREFFIRDIIALLKISFLFVGAVLSLIFLYNYVRSEQFLHPAIFAYDELDFKAAKFDKEEHEYTKEMYNYYGTNEIYFLEQAETITRAIRTFNKLNHTQKLGTNRWTPIPSKFRGLENYLRKTGKCDTMLEEFMHFSSPSFKVEGGAMRIEFLWKKQKTVEWVMETGPCKSRKCDYKKAYVDDAQLTLKEVFWRGDEKFEIKRAYYIEAKNLIEMFKQLYNLLDFEFE